MTNNDPQLVATLLDLGMGAVHACIAATGGSVVVVCMFYVETPATD